MPTPTTHTVCLLTLAAERSLDGGASISRRRGGEEEERRRGGGEEDRRPARKSMKEKLLKETHEGNTSFTCFN